MNAPMNSMLAARNKETLLVVRLILILLALHVTTVDLPALSLMRHTQKTTCHVAYHALKYHPPDSQNL